MTAITLNLPDEYVEQAKSKGVFNEFLLKELGTQFLTAKLIESLLPKSEKTWQDYFSGRDLSAVPSEFMQNRQQPFLENRNLFEGE